MKLRDVGDVHDGGSVDAHESLRGQLFFKRRHGFVFQVRAVGGDDACIVVGRFNIDDIGYWDDADMAVVANHDAVSLLGRLRCGIE